MTESTKTRVDHPSAPVRLVDEALSQIHPMATMWHRGLTLIPLKLQLPAQQPEYLTLDLAQQGDAIQIHEAPAQTVPFVVAVTKGDAVLLLGGDTLVGGAQNRIVNVTILLKAGATTQIPVSCLQRGRWDSGQQFASGRQADLRMRSMISLQVADGASTGRGSAFMANQSSVWSEISERQARAAMRSRTDALHDLYQAELPDLAELTGAFPLPAGSRGVAAGIDGRLVGLDLFDSAETFERQWSRLVEGYASALLDERRAVAAGIAAAPKHRHVDGEALGRMIGRARRALESAVVQPSVGAGEDVRFIGPVVHGSALVHANRVIHLAVFRAGTARATQTSRRVATILD